MIKEKTKSKIPVALTIAGSDSGGGAGIQADLKTFAALGVHGASAITSITAQNTQSVISVEDLSPRIIREQIRAVAGDLGIDAAKTGMLHTEEIIKTVASEVSNFEFPLVVDPVMVSKSGLPLLEPQAVDALKNYLLPKTTVVTPNRFEAEKLSGITIKSLEDAKIAAEKISGMGPKAVVVKGGHLEGKDAVDLLYYEGKFKTFTSERLDVKTTHGTGCVFSAAVAAELAKGSDILVAVEKAKGLVAFGIRFGLNIGEGWGPVNPMAQLYHDASRYDVLINVEKAKALIENAPEVSFLVPEVGMNIAMATPYAQNKQDVASIDGRITKTSEGARAVGAVKYGCSSHLARYILELMKYDETKMAAVNIKFSEDLLRILEQRNLAVSFYDRDEESETTRAVEGMTIPWGVKEAIKRAGKAPDIIYHRGGMGKEPMIVLFGPQASDLAKLVLQLAIEVRDT